uniref:Tubulin-specific chaperone C N-terminal domain-containing protein n=1 Tax=Crocodylus porosus TaxID=8502 RepID=A0A7M4FG27_CROPO
GPGVGEGRPPPAAAAPDLEPLGGDSATARGAIAVPERLQRRALAQQEATARRREVFATAFARERDAVEVLLAPGPPEAAAAAAVEEAAERLQALQRRVTDAVRFLAPYELRQAQETLARLQAALAGRHISQSSPSLCSAPSLQQGVRG